MLGGNRAYWGVLVAALGYFVDVYDLILFSVIRRASLLGIGVPEDQLLSVGIFLLNSQMAGMLVGGIFWGVLGDKRGRISVLFGSIVLYSIANIANGFVNTVELYALLRFVAGVGLAGELGAGITLVSETLPKETRGYGTTIVATIGVVGGTAAAIVGETVDWRIAYFIGGGMGLALLILRVAAHESGLFAALSGRTTVSRGNLMLIFSSRERLSRYLRCILAGLPIWYFFGIIVTFAPELGRGLNMPTQPRAADAVFWGYVGLVIGDVASGLLSQRLRSRKKAMLYFVMSMVVISAVLLSSSGWDAKSYYYWCVPLGIAAGYWAVFVTSAAEQFGTNLRATVTTSVPNFVRGAVIPMTLLFDLLKPQLGVVSSATWVGVIVYLIAIFSIITLRESFGNDLDFLES